MSDIWEIISVFFLRAYLTWNNWKENGYTITRFRTTEFNWKVNRKKSKYNFMSRIFASWDCSERIQLKEGSPRQALQSTLHIVRTTILERFLPNYIAALRNVTLKPLMCYLTLTICHTYPGYLVNRDTVTLLFSWAESAATGISEKQIFLIFGQLLGNEEILW